MQELKYGKPAKTPYSYTCDLCLIPNADILLPHHKLGAKRAVLDYGYLKATNCDNFKLIKCDGLQSAEGSDQRTLVDKAGNRHEVGIVILGNGFKTQDLLTPMSVYGLDGKNLREIWQQRGGSEAYIE
jgi:cation diffusion facilitator CzcD-associated flavoprotein CzcO